MRSRVFLRCVRNGNWKFARFIAGNFIYGLTHAHCKQCGAHKGFNGHARCYGCQVKNLYENLGMEPPA
jgi:hypothetical protein